jgi:geranylgeranyl diphosphate synthase, type I
VQEPLVRINKHIDDSISSLKGLRTDLGIWQRAIDGVLSLSSSPSKHLIRPQLVMLGYYGHLQSSSIDSVVPQRHEGIEKFAAGVELHHLFLLVHDDVMDTATIRRGNLTLPVLLSRSGVHDHHVANSLATVVGDLLHARSFSLMTQGVQSIIQDGSISSQRAFDALSSFVDCSDKVGAAQFEDIFGWRGIEEQAKSMMGRQPSSAKQPFRDIMMRLLIEKGALHGFMAPLLSGLLLSPHHNAQAQDAAVRWSRHAGVAFQALDDVSDFAGNPFETGKDSLKDFREGRLGVLLFLLRECVSDPEWDELKKVIYGHSGVFSIPDRILVNSLCAKYDICRQGIDLARTELCQANACLQQLDTSYVLRQGLESFSAGLAEHSKKVEEDVRDIKDD